MREVNITEVQKETFTDAKAITLWSALSYLPAEMIMVRDGKTETVGVLDDEMINIERGLLHF
jgi:hypothetical protein